MTHVATMGTSSCATIAIGGFNDKFGPQKQINEDYKNGKPFRLKGKETVSYWHDNVLYPVEQKLGKSGEYPFERLMEEIDKVEDLNTKFTIITLPSIDVANGYWPEELKRWGFIEADKTNNTIGSMNTIYIRNNNRPEGYKPFSK